MQTNLVQIARCEAFDIVPTEDDAEDVRCSNMGVRILETNEFGHLRLRYVCRDHGYETGLEYTDAS